MRLRDLLGIVTVAFVATVVPGCTLADDDVGPGACQRPPDGDWQLGDRELPDVTGMHPEAAAAAFDRVELAVSWRYHYATEPTGRTGYSECWCTAPPDGRVDDAQVTENGWVIVFVLRDAPILGGRPQPAKGWGCEGTASIGPPGATAAA